jgi:hypothetical protein
MNIEFKKKYQNSTPHSKIFFVTDSAVKIRTPLCMTRSHDVRCVKPTDRFFWSK